MMAATAIPAGTVGVASIVIWPALLSRGVAIDYILLPSTLLGSMLAAVAAPSATRVLPERSWRLVAPLSCLVSPAHSFCKVVPAVLAGFAR